MNGVPPGMRRARFLQRLAHPGGHLPRRTLPLHSLVAPLLCLLLLGAERPRVPAHNWHVAPSGAATGNGGTDRPWDLATALAGAAGRLDPGDTVWIHGGRYPGSFQTALAGLPDRPIVFRAWPGERATIDGTLKADGSYLVFWGFEIEQREPTILDTYGLQARTRGGRFINLVIHDAGTMGVSFWSPAEDAELYGCIIYNNGTHENLDHGVYVHNERGAKVLADNVLFNNLGYGIHVFAGRNNLPQDSIRLEGNIVFNNGTIARRYPARGNVIVGGDVPMSDMEVLDNLLYYSGRNGENLRLGYGFVANGALLARGNYLLGGARALRNEAWLTARLERNILAPEPEATVVTRPNRYEPGRAFIAVVNPSRAATVRVSLSGVLRTGQRYQIRNVQDPFGAPVASGTFTGELVSFPMTGVAPPVPLGRATAPAPRTGPAFDVFLVTPADSS